jgi:hypothetical protein
MKHDWEPMRPISAHSHAHGHEHFGADHSDAYSFTSAANKSMKSGKSGASSKLGQQQQPPQAAAGPKKNLRADWEQFYDENAKSKYWFNSKTGEASWTMPNFN